MTRRFDERGAVTAETAVVLPLLAVFAAGLAWLVGLGVVQARAQDAAREAARVVARGEPVETAVRQARRVATDGAEVTVDADADDVTVVVRAPVRGPGGLFDFLPAFAVEVESVAAMERP